MICTNYESIKFSTYRYHAQIQLVFRHRRPDQYISYLSSPLHLGLDDFPLIKEKKIEKYVLELVHHKIMCTVSYMSALTIVSRN